MAKIYGKFSTKCDTLIGTSINYSSIAFHHTQALQLEDAQPANIKYSVPECIDMNPSWPNYLLSILRYSDYTF